MCVLVSYSLNGGLTTLTLAMMVGCLDYNFRCAGCAMCMRNSPFVSANLVRRTAADTTEHRMTLNLRPGRAGPAHHSQRFATHMHLHRLNKRRANDTTKLVWRKWQKKMERVRRQQKKSEKPNFSRRENESRHSGVHSEIYSSLWCVAYNVIIMHGKFPLSFGHRAENHLSKNQREKKKRGTKCAHEEAQKYKMRKTSTSKR